MVIKMEEISEFFKQKVNKAVDLFAQTEDFVEGYILYKILEQHINNILDEAKQDGSYECFEKWICLIDEAVEEGYKKAAKYL